MGAIFETASSYESLLLSCGFDSLDAVFRWDRGDRLDKPGLKPWRQRWRISLPVSGGRPATFYLKRFLHPPFQEQCDRWFKGHWMLGTGGVEWHNARLLAQAGVPAAEAVAFGQEMVGPWERRSFVLLREVRGTSLEKWLPERVVPPEKEGAPRLRRCRLERLAELVALFHRLGFVHRDLYLSHIFIDAGSGEADGGTDERFCLIDLQRVFRPRWLHRRWVVKDLAALAYSTPSDRVSPAERLRFLARYARLCERFGDARSLAGPVQAKTARMVRRRDPGRERGQHGGG